MVIYCSWCAVSQKWSTVTSFPRSKVDSVVGLAITRTGSTSFLADIIMSEQQLTIVVCKNFNYVFCDMRYMLIMMVAPMRSLHWLIVIHWNIVFVNRTPRIYMGFCTQSKPSTLWNRLFLKLIRVCGFTEPKIILDVCYTVMDKTMKPPAVFHKIWCPVSSEPYYIPYLVV